MTKIPLVVDLDHTLINTDLLQQSLYQLSIKRPFYLLFVPFWLAKGKGYLKQRLIDYVKIDIKILTYNEKVLAYINKRRQQGDLIVLATASHQIYAQQVADFLGCFDEALGSNENFNLSSENKAQRLIALYGNKKFDYIGDHKRDIPVWQASYLAILVNTSARVERTISKLNLNTLKL